TAAAEVLPYLERLAAGVNVAEEVGGGRRPENGDLRVHVQVRSREKGSAVEAPVANDGVVLRDTGHARVGVLTDGGDLPAAGLLLGLGGGDRSAQLVLDRAHVVEREVLRLRPRSFQAVVAPKGRRDGDQVRAEVEIGRASCRERV